MLYLFIGALLAIRAKSQLTCGSFTCDESLGQGACITVATVETCGICNTDADCNGNSYWTDTVWMGQTNLECSDPLSTTINGCYPPVCTTSADCTSTSCISGYCVDPVNFGGCNVDGDCSTGQSCVTSDTLGYGVCVTGSFGCTSDDDCASGEGCVTVSSISLCVTGVSTCSSDSDCSDPTPTCATDYGICYLGCSSDSDCTSLDSSYTCQTDTASGLKGCGEPECTADSDCYSDEVCSSNSCVACAADSDCSTGESCIGNTCLVTDCTDDSDCLGFGFCRSDTCIICETDDDCTSLGYTSTFTCQTVSGVNVCSAIDLTGDDGINQITTYIAMIIMAAVALNM